MRLSINNIRGREEYLRKKKKKKEKALSSAPDGALKISYSHGKVQYKQIQAGGNKKESQKLNSIPSKIIEAISSVYPEEINSYESCPYLSTKNNLLFQGSPFAY